MFLDSYQLIFRQYTIENIEENWYLNNDSCIYIHIYHEYGYHVFNFLHNDELNLLLSLFQCTKDELVLKKVIGVELFGENVAIGYNEKYILFRDFVINGNKSNKLLSLEDLCKTLDVFKCIALDDNDNVIDFHTFIMKYMGGIVIEDENHAKEVRILRR